jgi:hypothetical protein
MKALLYFLLSLTVSHAAEPRIIFNIQTNRLERGIPSEAKQQKKVDPRSHGTLAQVLSNTLDTVTVRYFGNVWTNQAQVGAYLAGIFADAHTDTYTFQIWQQWVGTPEIECLLQFKNQQQGRLLLWDTACCVRDATGKWWFVSTFDYFHRKHPKGNRELSHKNTNEH